MHDKLLADSITDFVVKTVVAYLDLAYLVLQPIHSHGNILNLVSTKIIMMSLFPSDVSVSIPTSSGYRLLYNFI